MLHIVPAARLQLQHLQIVVMLQLFGWLVNLSALHSSRGRAMLCYAMLGCAMLASKLLAVLMASCGSAGCEPHGNMGALQRATLNYASVCTSWRAC